MLKMIARLDTGKRSTILSGWKRSSLFISSVDFYRLTSIGSDDEDENAGPAEQAQVPDAVKQEEPEMPARPSYDLHVYSVPELEKFNKKGLLADTTLLEGNYYFYS
jgi:hypothetical protein